MSEVEFNRIVDAVRKEIALVPTLHSLTGLRASDWRQRAVVEFLQPRVVQKPDAADEGDLLLLFVVHNAVRQAVEVVELYGRLADRL